MVISSVGIPFSFGKYTFGTPLRELSRPVSNPARDALDTEADW